MHRLSIVFLLIFSVSFVFLSCGGDDGSTSSSGTVKDSAMIVGNVEEEFLASNFKNHKSFTVEIKKLFTLVQVANAQDGELCGILVKAIQNGEVIATAETNCEGEFELNEIPQGLTTLMFETDLFTKSVVIDVPAGGTVEIKVSLDGDEDTEVSINEINITTGPVTCEDGAVNLGSEDIHELTIVGNGGNCVSVEGSCDISIIAENVNLSQCNVCINAVNGAFVTVTALNNFDCNAEGVGINSSGNSDVVVSGENCNIESGDFHIVEGEGSDVNTENCEEITLEVKDDDNGDADDGDGDNDGGNNNFVCEYDCSGNNCELFCTDLIPGDCVDICQNSDNISDCVQDCADLECGSPVCNEICIQATVPVCEVVEEEVCEEVCEGECEEECIEFRKEEVLNADCFENCLNGECEGLEGEAREICIGQHEAICADVCTDLVETDDCLEFEVVGCECDEVCEVHEVEVCEEVCQEEGISCRFECDEINI